MGTTRLIDSRYTWTWTWTVLCKTMTDDQALDCTILMRADARRLAAGRSAMEEA